MKKSENLLKEPDDGNVADRLEQLRAEVAEVQASLTSKENMEKIIDGMDELRILHHFGSSIST